jgi:hypothetical protein
MRNNLTQKLFVSICALLAAYASNAQQFQLDWAKSTRGGGYSIGNAIATDKQDNVITTGYYYGVVDFNPGNGSDTLASIDNDNDIYVQKLDSAGNLLWARTMGGSYDDRGQAIVTDNTGNIYIAGYFTGTAEFNTGGISQSATAAGNSDAFIAKLSPTGTLLWVKAFGGTDADVINGLAIDRDGNLYVTGYFYDQCDFDPSAGTTTLISNGGKDIFIAKYSNNGNFVWAKSIGGIDNDYANAITLDTAQNPVATGQYQNTTDFDPNAGTANLTSNGYGDVFIVKLSTSGTLLWAKGVGSTDFDDAGRGIAVDKWNNTILTGYYRGDVDFDPGAGVANFTWQSYNDIYVLKLTGAGNYLWAKTENSSGWEEGYSLTVDAAGYIYSTGYFDSDLDFDPNNGTTILTNAGYSDVYVQKLDPNGNLVWAGSVAGTGTDMSYGLTLDTHGNVLNTGEFNNTADFDPNQGVFNITVESQYQSAFQFKWYQSILSGIKPTGLADEIIAYPNPANSTLNIKLSEAYNQLTTEVYNNMGQLVLNHNFNATGMLQLDISTLPAGIYSVRISNGEQASAIRVIKQ